MMREEKKDRAPWIQRTDANPNPNPNPKWMQEGRNKILLNWRKKKRWFGEFPFFSFGRLVYVRMNHGGESVEKEM